MISGAIIAALVIRVLPYTRFAAFRTPIALILALAAGIPSLIIVVREFTTTDGAGSRGLLPPQAQGNEG